MIPDLYRLVVLESQGGLRLAVVGIPPAASGQLWDVPTVLIWGGRFFTTDFEDLPTSPVSRERPSAHLIGQRGRVLDQTSREELETEMVPVYRECMAVFVAPENVELCEPHGVRLSPSDGPGKAWKALADG